MIKLLDLNEEQYNDIEQLSSLGYTNEEIALYIDVDKDEFTLAANNSDNKINYHLRRGILLQNANAQMALQKSASKGDDKALKLLQTLRYDRSFEVAKRDILHNCEVSDEVFARLENYIQQGSLESLKPDEQLYIETLTIINSMRRKYGRPATIKFLQRAPFNLKYAKARDMYEHAINVFYVDDKDEKKEMRNLKDQQLEDAAAERLRMAKAPADFETYAKLIKLSAEIRQLHLPDAPEVPKGVFDKPIEIFALDPNAIGIDKPDRNALARQIDTIPGATEAEKRRAAMDAGVSNINIEDYFREYEEDSEY